jgi:hypothetical protein
MMFVTIAQALEHATNGTVPNFQQLSAPQNQASLKFDRGADHRIFRPDQNTKDTSYLRLAEDVSLEMGLSHSSKRYHFGTRTHSLCRWSRLKC